MSLNMTKPIPTVQKYMTTAPHTIGVEQTLAVAHELLKAHHIRHLPVLGGGQLVGMLTQRDIAVVEGLAGVDPKKVLVEDAMSSEVYSVSPEAPLDEVASEMAEKKYGSVVVMQNHKVVGIFTTVDLARTLTELLRARLKS
jgi:acetoin utilization protein AcuB